MKTFIVLALAIVAALALPKNSSELHAKWNEFKLAHNKVYSNAIEEIQRKIVFQQNLNEIDEHNAKYASGEETYYKAVNQFADWTKDEFLAYVNKGLNKPAVIPEHLKLQHVESATPLAAQVDWRSSAVTEVKNQGQCGSCWSFSATGAIEGQLALRQGRLISLSEQNLMDCSTAYGNEACNGGWMESAFSYVHDQGIDTESAYPYEGRLERCRFDAAGSVTTVSGIYEVRAGDEGALADATANYGPIAVAMDATNELQLYGGGILNDRTCSSSSSSLNHGVLIVGYGNEGGTDYWIVKNSWGRSWGEAGFWRHVRNSGNNCGFATDASFPAL